MVTNPYPLLYTSKSGQYINVSWRVVKFRIYRSFLYWVSLIAIQKQALILHLHPPIGDDNVAKKVVMDSASPSSNLQADIVLAASCSYRFPDLTHGSFD